MEINSIVVNQHNISYTYTILQSTYSSLMTVCDMSTTQDSCFIFFHIRPMKIILDITTNPTLDLKIYQVGIGDSFNISYVIWLKFTPLLMLFSLIYCLKVYCCTEPTYL